MILLSIYSWLTLSPLVGIAPLAVSALIKIPPHMAHVDHYCTGWTWVAGEEKPAKNDPRPIGRRMCRWGWRGVEQLEWRIEREGTYNFYLTLHRADGEVVKRIEQELTFH